MAGEGSGPNAQVFVGDVTADPGLWGFCGDAAMRERWLRKARGGPAMAGCLPSEEGTERRFRSAGTARSAQCG